VLKCYAIDFLEWWFQKEAGAASNKNRFLIISDPKPMGILVTYKFLYNMW
jgi:hypothetical protein